MTIGRAAARSLAVAFVILAVAATACTRVTGRPDPALLEPSVVRLAGTACLRPILGTAFVVGEGQVLTVAHALAGADEDLRIVTTGGASHDVLVIGFDPERDLALLSVPDLTAAVLPLGRAQVDGIGNIAAVASDLRLNAIPYRVRRIVNARSGDIYDEGAVERTALDVEASISPGDSGAPLVATSRAVVGIVFASSNDRAETAWALDASEIEAFLASVDETTEVDRGRCR